MKHTLELDFEVWDEHGDILGNLKTWANVETSIERDDFGFSKEYIDSLECVCLETSLDLKILNGHNLIGKESPLSQKNQERLKEEILENLTRCCV